MEPSTEQIKAAAASAANKPGVLSLAIKEKSALYAAYMPYVKGGGLFIPTNKNFKINITWKIPRKKQMDLLLLGHL